MADLKPLRLVEMATPNIGWHSSGDVPNPATYSAREVLPVYGSGPFAVYDLGAGAFEVHGNGIAAARPFATLDLDLAREVCDRWAADLASLYPGDHP